MLNPDTESSSAQVSASKEGDSLAMAPVFGFKDGFFLISALLFYKLKKLLLKVSRVKRFGHKVVHA
jgi:hypothetical protein